MILAIFGPGGRRSGRLARTVPRVSGAAADAAEKVGRKPTDEQTEAKKELDAQRKQRKPSSEELEKDAQKWRGNPMEVIRVRAKFLATWQGLPYYDPVNCDVWSMMFIGRLPAGSSPRSSTAGGHGTVSKAQRGAFQLLWRCGSLAPPGLEQATTCGRNPALGTAKSGLCHPGSER